MKPSASSWADEVEENSRGRLLSPLEHATPAVPGEPVIHSTPSANREPAIHATPAVAREPAIHPISAPTIPGGSHRVRELVRDIKGLKLGAAGNNNNFQKRWEEAKKAGNLSSVSFTPHLTVFFFQSTGRTRESGPGWRWRG